MKVGIEMLQGEYYYRVEQYERAFNHLKQSVEEHDRLNYGFYNFFIKKNKNFLI